MSHVVNHLIDLLLEAALIAFLVIVLLELVKYIKSRFTGDE